ncbi:hypothetical protein [Nostoc flagelliforme]|uniref:hypothetical protein n=1 Tax=Nostoc flagelliforme TaxID=1306274 RepID=UPI0012FD2B3A|nr:hypothetical protein [Nostoc flagelliforme]
MDCATSKLSSIPTPAVRVDLWVHPTKKRCSLLVGVHNDDAVNGNYLDIACIHAHLSKLWLSLILHCSEYTQPAQKLDSLVKCSGISPWKPVLIRN